MNSANTMVEFLATNNIRNMAMAAEKMLASGISIFGYAKSDATTQNAPKVPVTSQTGTI